MLQCSAAPIGMSRLVHAYIDTGKLCSVVNVGILSYAIQLTFSGSNLKHPVVKSWLYLSMDKRNTDDMVFICRSWS